MRSLRLAAGSKYLYAPVRASPLLSQIGFFGNGNMQIPRPDTQIRRGRLVFTMISV